MSAPEKPALSAIVSPRSLDDFFVGFTPREAGYVVSEGDSQSEISELMLFPLWVVCHEYRRSKRRCATVREMKEGPSGSAIRS